jgi:hypothetical protein
MNEIENTKQVRCGILILKCYNTYPSPKHSQDNDNHCCINNNSLVKNYPEGLNCRLQVNAGCRSVQVGLNCRLQVSAGQCRLMQVNAG